MQVLGPQVVGQEIRRRGVPRQRVIPIMPDAAVRRAVHHIRGIGLRRLQRHVVTTCDLREQLTREDEGRVRRERGAGGVHGVTVVGAADGDEEVLEAAGLDEARELGVGLHDLVGVVLAVGDGAEVAGCEVARFVVDPEADAAFDAEEVLVDERVVVEGDCGAGLAVGAEEGEGAGGGVLGGEEAEDVVAELEAPAVEGGKDVWRAGVVWRCVDDERGV